VTLLQAKAFARRTSDGNHGFFWSHTCYLGPSLDFRLASAARDRTLEAEIDFRVDHRAWDGLAAYDEGECDILPEFVIQRRALEPDLSPAVRDASRFPGDAHGYPFLLVAGLANTGRRHGVRLRRARVDD
jgi:glycine/D-amino acid oxidase-like deaminating enzyme